MGLGTFALKVIKKIQHKPVKLDHFQFKTRRDLAVKNQILLHLEKKSQDLFLNSFATQSYFFSKLKDCNSDVKAIGVK